MGLATGLMGGGMLVPLGAIYADEVLGAGKSGLGVLITALGLGVAAGVGLVSWLQRRLDKARAFTWSLIGAGIFLALAVSSISVIGILMAGWASSSKYSLLGALRAAGQLVAYELPLVLAVVGVVIQAGTLNVQGIVMAQATGEIFGWGGIGNPFIFTQFLGFAIFLVAVQAELTQPPFDMPVAESELVTGYLTEYSGLRFLLFFIGEFATAGIFAALAATLFLGGWYVPGIDPTSDLFNVIGPAVLLGKVILVSFLIFWFRFTYPRFREDQLQQLAWKVLIPLSLANIVVTGVLKVVF
ncbi:MAG TPA: NADH-quinone oxidoreductase subunit H [Acidimicrobiaceae bacterium]|nr:NADH-quinone oxidoreductase subunit H [Acidimicrobiaceae bacterium]